MRSNPFLRYLFHARSLRTNSDARIAQSQLNLCALDDDDDDDDADEAAV